VISVLTTLVGLLCAALVFVVCEWLGWYWARCLEAAFYTLGGFGVLGILLAVFALARRERVWGVSVLGLVLNGALATFFLWG
jgi:hypothetical protein